MIEREVVAALAEIVRQHRPEHDLVALAKIERVSAYRRRGDAGATEHVDAYLRKRLDLRNETGLDRLTRRAAFIALDDRLRAEQGPTPLRSFADLPEPDPFDVNPTDDPIRIGAFATPPDASHALRLRAREQARHRTAPPLGSYTPDYPPPAREGNGWSTQTDPFTGEAGLTMSTDLYDDHVRKVQAITAAHLDQATDKVYATKDDKGNIVWSPDRVAIHKQIVDEIMAKATAPDSPIKRDHKAIMTGGLMAAGKSTVMASPTSGQYLTLNADDMKDELISRGLAPKIDGLEPLEGSLLIHEESSALSLMLADQAEAQGLNVIWDLSMKGTRGVQSRLDKLKANGYDTKAVFVDVEVQTSLARATARHKRGVEDFEARGKGLGGRFVDPYFIISETPAAGSNYRSQNRATFEGFKDQFYDWQIWDTTNNPPVLLDEVPAGTVHTWADGKRHVKGSDGVWTLAPH